MWQGHCKDLLHALGPAKIGQTGRDDIEGGALAAFDELRQNLSNFDETARPAVAEEQRNGIGDTAPLVNVVDLERTEAADVDARGILRELIECPLVLPPVVARSPMVDETLNVG